MYLVFRKLTIVATMLSFMSYSLGNIAQICADQGQLEKIAKVQSAKDSLSIISIISADPCHKQGQGEAGSHSNCECSCHGYSAFLVNQGMSLPLPSKIINSKYTRLKYGIFIPPASPPPKFS